MSTQTATPRIPKIPGAPKGHCRWCQKPIDKEKPGQERAEVRRRERTGQLAIDDPSQ